MADPNTVDVPTTWHDLDSARSQWRDAPRDDEQLQTLLNIARAEVLTFAPDYHDEDGNVAPLPDDAVPVNYRLAQLMQARNRQNATKVDPANGALGDDTFTIRPFPLDWAVKQTIRPKKGVVAWV